MTDAPCPGWGAEHPSGLTCCTACTSRPAPPPARPAGLPTMKMVQAATDAWNRAEDRPGGAGPLVGSSYVATVGEMLDAAISALLADGYSVAPPAEPRPFYCGGGMTDVNSHHGPHLAPGTGKMCCGDPTLGRWS